MAEGGAKKRNELCNSPHVIQLFIVQPIELASGIVNALGKCTKLIVIA